MKRIKLFPLLVFLILTFGNTHAQEANSLKLSGELYTDQRFLLKSPNDWAWNENRLTLNLEKVLITLNFIVKFGCEILAYPVFIHHPTFITKEFLTLITLKSRRHTFN